MDRDPFVLALAGVQPVRSLEAAVERRAADVVGVVVAPVEIVAADRELGRVVRVADEVLVGADPSRLARPIVSEAVLVQNR